ncbi:MAG TPA: TadE/TadG family type IV pilus assembly protein [Phycisphaerae bacterium]|jgi:Flp pilus assembly protein TadG|nr:pilus assembly protein [Phycisphaerae bacterium]HOB74707.1 TadE/TadG family type IV pilus assembly protein [Phycisphaerae bacterium]HOJ56553.1 TadE/TadG family type IV pilus assembly protein [Phycisphaerae bacterium]HOL25248.1 TadE/TadG family type IV pilus assembly protein [Phycisphaerae bacterium]HPP22756.1 TadE/TadG family type IV pilus assembly protein [Phycisphaerae bacterium]
MARLTAKSMSRGLALVEAAIVLPLLLLLVFGVLEYGWMFYKASEVTNAARDGARTAALHGGTDARARAKIIAAMSAAGMTIGDGNITISPSADPPTTPGTTVTVTVSVAYKGNVELMRFPLLPVPEKLSASVSMAKEGP